VNDNEDHAAQLNRRVLYAFLIGTLVVGLTASLFTEPNIAGWYAALAKPSFNPPNWIFAPVWTAL
jgi:tryptophan-rich sensory protein